jgi:SAM-dependent methyltransferase
MSALPPRLTDRDALARNRRRATLQGFADFLHLDVAVEIEERLSEVNRTFTSPAVVSGFPDFWARRLPGARVVPDTETLALEAQAHDLVIHALALHWADDPVGQLVQCRLALRPDGLFIGALFGGRTLSELRAALAEAEAALTGGLSPRILPMGDIRDLGGLLQRAGFALPVADSSLRRLSYAAPLELMRDLRAMGEGNALDARQRHPRALRSMFAEASDRYTHSFGLESPDGPRRISATFEVIYLTGWAPDPRQQQPLRPGSAATRLADALGTAEIAVPDRAGGPRD